MEPAAQRIFDEIAGGPRGLVEGPLRVWLHSPGLAEPAQRLGLHCRYGSALEPRISELVIITIGAFWQAGFEWHVHLPLALAAGVSEAAAAAIHAGRPPAFNKTDEAVAHDFARSLIADRCVPDELFARAVAEFGERGVVDLVGIVGYYSFIAMTIRAFDVETPGGDPFSPQGDGAGFQAGGAA